MKPYKKDVPTMNHIVPNGHIVYQAKSPWDYLWAKELETIERQHRRSRWIEYPYNRTHHLKEHTITREFVFEPIRFLRDDHNATHYRITDTQRNTIEYKPYPVSTTIDPLFAPLVLFLFALFAYFFLTEKPEPRRRRR